MSSNDNELMLKLVNEDDTEAFNKLVLSYRVSAINFAYRYTRDYHKAEDIAQEAFARIYINRKNFRPENNFSTYLFTILRNLCIDHFRKNSSRVPEQSLDKNLDISPPENTPTPEETIIKKERQSFIRNLLNSLDEKYKTVLYLQLYEGMSYQEIARVMKMTKGQVKMLIYRGKRKFKKLVQEELKDFGE